MRAARRVPGLQAAHQRWHALRHQRTLNRTAGARLLRAFADAYPEAFFVEVGANDGQGHDHLRALIERGGWRGIMVEPVPYVFNQLVRNYGQSAKIAFEPSAIADRDGQLPFFHIEQIDHAAEKGIPEWYNALGSFQRETVEWHTGRYPELQRHLVTTSVDAITFDTLCRRHNVDDIDLLVIDTEGYDDAILRAVDLERYHPRLIVYEHFHLGDERRAATSARMQKHGYEMMEEHLDTWCFRPAADPLTEVWRSLRPALSSTGRDGR